MPHAARRSMLLDLLAICTFAACSSPDLCARSVDVTDKLESEYTACAPNAGFPKDTDPTARIQTCDQQLAQCTDNDQKTLQKSVSCYESLPAIDCSWFVPEGSGVNPGFSWGQQFLGCFPQGLGATCTVASPPLDAGFNF